MIEEFPVLLFLNFLFAFMSLNNAQCWHRCSSQRRRMLFDKDSVLPVEAVAIAAELKKGRSRTRAFPIHLQTACTKAFTTGTIIFSRSDPTNR